MDLVHVLRALWRDRLWVAVGALVALVATVFAVFRVSPLSFELTPRATNISAATTEVLVDSNQTFLGDLRREVEPLTQRAGVFARFVESDAVVDALARKTGIPAEKIAVHGPVVNASEAADPTAEQRANEIRDASEPYRVQVTFSNNLPIFSVFTQAPNVDAARRLADGLAGALRSVVANLQGASQDNVSRANRVRIRQIGKAEAGVLNQRASYVLGWLVFIGVFIAACVLILVARSVKTAWQDADESAADLRIEPFERQPDPGGVSNALTGPEPDWKTNTLHGIDENGREVETEEDLRQRRGASA